jgi:hypothetical protein
MKAFVPLTAITLTATTALAANPNEFLVFNLDSYGNGLTSYTNDLPGRLFIPANYDPSISYPVVTFLHGNGEKGNNNTSQVNNNINNLLQNAKDRNFILYAPQAIGGWEVEYPGTFDLITAQLAKITTQYNVDMSRMYITGLSLGGGGTMDILGMFPHVFAAGVNICGSDNRYAPQYSKLVNTPIWIHHAQNDTTVSVWQSRNTVNGIRNAKGLGSMAFPAAPPYTTPVDYDDGILRYNEYTSGGHGIWGSVYGNSAVYDWMLSKSRTIPELQLNQRVQFDLGGARLASAVNGVTWNSTASGLFSITGPVSGFGSTTTGVGTRVSLEVTDPFNGEFNNGGANNGSNDGWSVTPDDVGGVRLIGLTPGLAYDIELFASRAFHVGTTRFTVGGLSQDLYHYANASETAIFEQVIADANGSISILVAPAPGSTAGFLNWVSATAVVPEPGSAAILGLAVMAFIGRRRSRRCTA